MSSPTKEPLHVEGSPVAVSAGCPYPSACAELLGSSPVVLRAVELVRQAAPAIGNVLIVAARGLDATSVGREIHSLSPRASAPFLVVDRAAADPTAVERELLGRRVSGRSRDSGDLEIVDESSVILEARDGTVFLQHIGELPASAQIRLARVLRDGEVRIDGFHRSRSVGARLVAGADPSLAADVEEGRFRADLYRRLCTFEIEVPPLRERAEDIPTIAIHSVREICASADRPVREFTQVALTLLLAFSWRGNIGDLRALLERVIVTGSHETIRLEDLLAHMRLDGATAPLVPDSGLKEARQRFEREYIAAVLQHHRWRMSEAARELGIQRTNLYRKVWQLGIRRTQPITGER